MKRIILILLALVISIFFVIKEFSLNTNLYECEGKYERNKTIENKKVFLKFEEFRWWVHLWSDKDGYVYIEIPNQEYNFFNQVESVGDNIQITEQYQGRFIFKGMFSRLSKSLLYARERESLDGLPNIESFEGSCSIVGEH